MGKKHGAGSKCVHSCKGLCNALEVAELREQEAITMYRQYAEQCDYPDVRTLLLDLIAHRQETIRLLRAKREALATKFGILDSISDSFL